MSNLRALCISGHCATVPEVYTKDEVNALIDNIETAHLEEVEELPSTGEANVIYLVPKDGGTYKEYAYVGGKWEEIGDTDIDLSGYATTEDLNREVDALGALISGLQQTKQDKLTAGDNVTIQNNTVAVNLDDYLKSADVDKDYILEKLGYEEIEISKTDADGETVKVYVLGRVYEEPWFDSGEPGDPINVQAYKGTYINLGNYEPSYAHSVSIGDSINYSIKVQSGDLTDTLTGTAKVAQEFFGTGLLIEKAGIFDVDYCVDLSLVDKYGIKLIMANGAETWNDVTCRVVLTLPKD